MRLLPHMDPSLRAHRRTTLRLAKEEQDIRMGKGTYRGGPEVKTNVYRGTGFAQSNIRTRTPVYITMDTSPAGYGS